eukprot:5041425-Amphidinium_carterae.1
MAPSDLVKISQVKGILHESLWQFFHALAPVLQQHCYREENNAHQCRSGRNKVFERIEERSHW